MKRKAVLIESSDVRGHNDLPGARIDVDNWKAFLGSDLGGSWLDSEIVVLRKPYSADIDRELTVPADYYTFITFSGHGAFGTVALNESYERFPTSLLRPRTSRGTLIVDSCRGIASGRYTFKTNAIALANATVGSVIAFNAIEGRSSNVLLEGPILNRAYAEDSVRSKWESGFGISSGTVEMYSCAKGQGAEEDPNAGGYYTSLLLASADAWNKGRNYESIHTTKAAHDYAVKMLPPQQTPEYSPTWLAYPLAVK
jgi:hypothetical protein